MKNKKNKKNFIEYIKEINSYNNNITINNSYHPFFNETIYSIYNEEFKKLVYQNIYNRLVNILTKIFKWGVPDYINKRVIEIGYIYRGGISFFYDNEYKIHLCLPATISNIYNIYGDPTQVRVLGFNGYNKNIDIKDPEDIPVNFENLKEKSDGYGVYSADNDLRYPYIKYIEEYASLLADAKVALAVATQNLKKPMIFTGKEPYLKDDVDELSEKIRRNDPTIFITKVSDDITNEKRESPIEVYNLPDHSNSVKAIKDVINFYFNEFLELIGINTNPSPDKTQVVLNDELNSNNLLIDIEQDVRFFNRLKLCSDVKKIFNIDLKVEKNLPELKDEIIKTKKMLNDEGGNTSGGKSKKISRESK